MNWELQLTAGEELLWEGRPAPRCFMLREWRHALFGVLFLLFAVFWQAIGLQMAAVYALPWLALVPVPFVLFGLHLALGRMLLARLEWPRVRYAMTDRRLLVRRGLGGRKQIELDLAAVTYFQLLPHGKELGTLRVYAAGERRGVALHCIEYPHRVVEPLEAAMQDSICRLPAKDAD